MALYNSFVFGELRNKLANVVAMRSRGKGVLRSNPMKIKNPRTPGQLTQRAKMSAAIGLSQDFRRTFKLGFAGQTQDQSAYNIFVSENLENISVDDAYQVTVDYSGIRCSKGKLELPKIEVTLGAEGNQITITQPKEDEYGDNSDTDMAYAVLYEKEIRKLLFVPLYARSQGGSKEVKFPASWSKESVYLYAFMVNQKKTAASKTLYVPLG